MTLHIMSDKELARLEVLRDLTSGRLTAMAAAELLGLERRQVQRLAKAYQASTPPVRKRGRIVLVRVSCLATRLGLCA